MECHRLATEHKVQEKISFWFGHILYSRDIQWHTHWNPDAHHVIEWNRDPNPNKDADPQCVSCPVHL